ncbi:MAG: permease-like cell division protein FtsX [Rhodanobacteraceae bacterium]
MLATRGGSKRKRNVRKPDVGEGETTGRTRVSRAPLRNRLHAWRDQHLYSLFSSLGRLMAKPWATALTTLVLGFALALPLLFFLVFVNSRDLAGGLREAREITVFLKPDIEAASAAEFAVEIGRRADVDLVVVRTPKQGLAEFRQLSGFSGALDVLQSNPLPSVLLISPREAAVDDRNPAIIDVLRSDPRVDLVQYDAVWRRRLDAVLGVGQRAVEVLAAILALAALLVVGNTVRLDIQGRAEEIEVMQLMGAGNGFVRRPFLYTGIWYGLLGGVFAVIAVGVVEFALAAPLERLLVDYGHRFALHGLDLVVATAVIALSAVLGWVGALIASTRHLLRGDSRA